MVFKRILERLRGKKKRGFEEFAERTEQRRQRIQERRGRKQELKRLRTERKEQREIISARKLREQIKEFKKSPLRKRFERVGIGIGRKIIGKAGKSRRPKIIQRRIVTRGLSKTQFQRLLKERRRPQIQESILTERSGFFVNGKKPSKNKKMGFFGKGQI